MTVPKSPKIYHITHVDNLPAIIGAGGLFSDAELLRLKLQASTIGMSSIKQRRLQLPVSCHPGTSVGDFVPFYFCPRSIMLYVIKCANHPELTYRGGQEPIVHLEADLHAVVRWAAANSVSWVFTLSNAGAFYTSFRSALQDLEDVDWSAIAATDWRDPGVREGKQAEFLVHRAFPWALFDRIGVRTAGVASRAARGQQSAQKQVRIDVIPDWYYP